MVNLYLKLKKSEYKPQTTYEPHTSVIDPSDKVLHSVALTIEDMTQIKANTEHPMASIILLKLLYSGFIIILLMN